MFRYPQGRGIPDVSMAGGMLPGPYDMASGMVLHDGGIPQKPLPVGALISALANASPSDQRTVSTSLVCVHLFSLDEGLRM